MSPSPLRIRPSSNPILASPDRSSNWPLAADRVYMQDAQEGGPAAIALSEINFGALPMTNRLPRLAARFYQDAANIDALRQQIGKKISAKEALSAGLVTSAPDDLDWEDELRQAIESRAAQSPTPSPASKPIFASAETKRWKPVSSAASPHGKTGFSFVPTR